MLLLGCAVRSTISSCSGSRDRRLSQGLLLLNVVGELAEGLCSEDDQWKVAYACGRSS